MKKRTLDEVQKRFSHSQNREIEEAWAAEVEWRIEEIESGRARLVPAAEAIARARAALKSNARGAPAQNPTRPTD